MTTIHDDAKRLAKLLGSSDYNVGQDFVRVRVKLGSPLTLFTYGEVRKVLAAFDSHYEAGKRAGMKAKPRRKRK